MEVIFAIVAASLPILRYGLIDVTVEWAVKFTKFVITPTIFIFFLESNLDIGINSVICFRMMMDHIGNFWKGWIIMVSLILFGNVIFLIVIPILLIIKSRNYIMYYFKGLPNIKNDQYLFGELDVTRKLSIYYHVVFVCRRYILVTCLFAKPKNFVFQIYLYFVASNIYYVYLIHTRPFKDRFLNRMELLNEGLVVFSSYFLYLFTEFLLPQERTKYGWVFLICVSFNIFVNLIVSIYDATISFKEKIKYFKKKENFK